jgi:hypothetical protein
MSNEKCYHVYNNEEDEATVVLDGSNDTFLLLLRSLL